MAKAKTQEKKNQPPATGTGTSGHPPVAGTGTGGTAVATANDPPKGLRLRLGYPHTAQAAFGVDAQMWRVLVDAVWPAARTSEAVMLALAYCKSRNLDPMKKMVHIVPVWSKDAPIKEEGRNGGYIETVWPGIAEIRTTATRTLVYAGKDATKFGPLIEHEFVHEDSRERDPEKKRKTKTVTYPEWAEVTVYKMVQGQRCAFVGPRVYWMESYASESRWSEIPNEMWASRPSGQLEKCAEAGALRAAFPEEIGGEYAAEEVNGRVIEHSRPRDELKPLIPGEVRPNPVQAEEFARAEPEGDPVQDAQVEEVHEEGTPAQAAAAVVEDDEPPAIANAKLDEILANAKKRFSEISKFGALADAREEFEGEFPPESPQLAELIKAYDARIAEIKAASK